MRVLRTAVVYFVLVFGAGFALGILRVLLVLPALGTRSAELLEMPLMLAVVVAAAHFVTRRMGGVGRRGQWIAVGVVALALMLIADVGVGVWLRGMSVWEALFARDPLSGTAYYLSLGVLALAPWLTSGAAAASPRRRAQFRGAPSKEQPN
jgi:hypothetical protein